MKKDELTTQTPIELFDNAQFIGNASMTGDNKWEYALRNLSEGPHVLTAKTGNTTSKPYTVQVGSSSGSEEWEGFALEYRLASERFYLTQSGLIFYIRYREGEQNQNAVIWRDDTNKRILSISGDRDQVFEVLLPVSATRVSISIAQQLDTSSRRDRLIFITSENDVIERSMTGAIGEKIFEFGLPVKALVYYPFGSYQFGGPTVSISKISWSSPA